MIIQELRIVNITTLNETRERERERASMNNVYTQRNLHILCGQHIQ